MKYASGPRKSIPLVCLVTTLTTSLALFLIRDKRYIHRFPTLLRDHRNLIQVFVQVLSSILSLTQMLVLTTLINFAARIRLFESPTTMSNLSFWSALLISRFEKTLPPIKLGLVALLLASTTILGALWAGSLTPLSTTAFRDDGSVLVPYFNADMTPAISARSTDGAILSLCHDNDTADPRGRSYPTLDNCMVLDKIGSLIMSAATATNVTNPRLHPKIDNTTWTYRGRSYGKGSMAGLFNVSDMTLETPDIGFSYQEHGYNIQPSCEKQNFTMLSFQQQDTDINLGAFKLWYASHVTLGTGNVSIPPFYMVSPLWNHFNKEEFGYFAWSAVTQNGTHSLVTASQNNSWSKEDEQLICTIDFVPWSFDVNISKTDQSITVTPLEELTDLNQTGNIADMIVLELDLVSRFSSSSVVFSSLYEAIVTNYRAAQIAYADLDVNRTYEYCMRDAISEIVDDLLTYHGILAVAGHDNDSVSQPVKRHFLAVQIGQRAYQIAQLVINIALCILYLFEVYRTRYWRHLPDFDFLDIDALITAASGSQKSSTNTPTGFPHTPIKWRKNDDRKVMATDDGQYGVRLVFSDSSGEARQLTSRTESSLHLLDNLRPWRSQPSPVQDPSLANIPDRNLLSPRSDFQVI